MTDSNTHLPATVEQPQPARPKTWPLWVIAGLALLLVLALAFWSWVQWNRQQTLEQSVSYLRTSTERLDQTISQAGGQQGQRIQALEDALRKQRDTLATQRRQIDHNARVLLEAGSRTRTDWLLAEAEYLLRVANQRLVIEKDFRGALAALKEGDKVLAETDDIGTYPVRQALAKEILALKGLTGVDRTGLYLQLEASIASIQQLTDSALAGEAPPSLTQPATDPDPTDNPLLRAWHKVRNTLARVVVVRRLDEPVKPLMSPEQSAYARLNMQLMLEEAEMAVLRGHQALYERALSKALAALNDWYDHSDSRIAAIESTLNELKDQDIDPQLPDISESLNLLKARMAGRTKSGPAEPATESGDTGDAS
ncbi:MAG: uroporphyrinogen-III C-methyltransferase [Marinobacter sp.]|nr:uroporphyrinogen-III C-methyltransferase [Marinobacter sp.]